VAFPVSPTETAYKSLLQASILTVKGLGHSITAKVLPVLFKNIFMDVFF
jgi:hypothetical protein